MKYTCEAMRRMSGEVFYYHPYRQRKNSTTSTYSDESSSSGSSSPSGSMTSPPPSYDYQDTYQHHQQNLIYNRLKQYISEVPKDPVVCQILLESLSQVIELERQLAELEQKTHHLKMAQHPSNSNEKVPEDLANVDVTEFKHLVHSAPLVYESISY